MVPIVIYSRNDFYLLEAFNKRIGVLQAAGFIEFWQYQDIERTIADDEASGHPEVLTFVQLVGSFQLLLVGYVLSVIAFVVEFFIPLIKGHNKISF